MYDLKWMYKAIIIVTLQLLQLKIIIVPALVFHGIACCVAITVCRQAGFHLHCKWHLLLLKPHYN